MAEKKSFLSTITKEDNAALEDASTTLASAIGALESEMDASGISKDDKASRLSYIQDKLNQNRVSRRG